RVNATVAGRDVHLTKAERRAVVRAAYRHGLTEQRLAWLLKISEEHAQKLYRETRRALRNRDLEQTTKTTPPPRDRRQAPGPRRLRDRGVSIASAPSTAHVTGWDRAVVI